MKKGASRKIKRFAKKNNRGKASKQREKDEFLLEEPGTYMKGGATTQNHIIKKFGTNKLYEEIEKLEQEAMVDVEELAEKINRERDARLGYGKSELAMTLIKDSWIGKQYKKLKEKNVTANSNSNSNSNSNYFLSIKSPEAIWMDDDKAVTQLENEQKMLKKDIWHQKRRAAKSFREAHPWLIGTLDVMMVLIVLFNISVLMMTNAMVVKAEPDVQFIEINPEIARRNELATTPEAKFLFTGFITHLISFGAILGYYIILRQTTHDHKGYKVLLLYAIILFTMLGLDFFNDLGFLIGKLIWGV